MGKAGLILINRSTTLNTYIYTYAGTWTGPKCSVGWGQKVEHHLGYKSVRTEKCLSYLGRKKR